MDWVLYFLKFNYYMKESKITSQSLETVRKFKEYFNTIPHVFINKDSILGLGFVLMDPSRYSFKKGIIILELAIDGKWSLRVRTSDEDSIWFSDIYYMYQLNIAYSILTGEELTNSKGSL